MGSVPRANREQTARTKKLSAALQQLNAISEDTILIGDSPFDFAAAETGQLKTYLVATGSHTENELAETTKAAGIYADLYELGAALFGLTAETTKV